MHKKSSKRTTYNPKTQKIQSLQHLKINEYEDNDYTSNSFTFYNICKNGSSWAQTSPSSSVSWSEDLEEISKGKLFQEWNTIERTFYDEEKQTSHKSILDECLLWRAQVPYLRIVGKKLLSKEHSQYNDFNSDQIEISDNNWKTERRNKLDNVSEKETEGSLKQKLHRRKFNIILGILLDHVNFELFHKTESKVNSLNDKLSDVLKVTSLSISNNTNMEEKSSLDDFNQFNAETNSNIAKNTTKIKFSNKNRDKVCASSNKSENVLLATNNVLSLTKDQLYTPPIVRNKLGTIFNQKTIVSPVPFVVSTKESFRTIQTTPIKYLKPCLEPYALQERRIKTGIKSSIRKANTIRMTNVRSAWDEPVHPTIWPKNIKLAPIDTSRLPSANRSFVPSPFVLQCNRRPLSPISRRASNTPPSNIEQINGNDHLEIEGKHITMESRLNLRSGSWDLGSTINNKMKRKKDFDTCINQRLA
ncbi:uncharacterized protein [Prorops nasuta]|uniref:uncharacterized protein isoform X2 n=1 Tax=Prorops nasuta TaxID=863751 RepID=UPI0034CE13D5